MKNRTAILLVILLVIGAVSVTLLMQRHFSESQKSVVRGVELDSEMGDGVATENLAPTETAEVIEEVLPTRGYSENIPEDVQKIMAGVSMPANAKVKYDDLAYLTIYYIDFNDNHATGNIIVAKALAEEVLDIFEELYKIKYPIESVRIIDEFKDKQTKELDTLDNASMGHNNTSSFCYRQVVNGKSMSQHSYGRAIDLNPKINPYVVKRNLSVSPANAKKYIDRSGKGLTGIENRAMLHTNDDVYKIFTSRGWTWGGNAWNTIYDYQHFEKPAK